MCGATIRWDLKRVLLWDLMRVLLGDLMRVLLGDLMHVHCISCTCIAYHARALHLMHVHYINYFGSPLAIRTLRDRRRRDVESTWS